MVIAREKKIVLLLSFCQALFMTGNSLQFILGGLVGAQIAETKALATLPLTATIVGVMCSTIPASLLMKRIGRRAGFMAATVWGAGAMALAAWAVYDRDFWLFTLAMLLYGGYGGFAQYYRFAAADIASPQFRSRAISYVLAGGIAAAVAGPTLAKWSTDLFAPITFLGGYVVVCVLSVAATALLTFLDIPRPSEAEARAAGRPMRQIMAQPVFVVAVLCGMIGYGVMSLVMTSTPLAMIGCGFAVNDAADVIQWHILGMFVPSLFTGTLIARFGLLNVMLAGVALLLFCVIVAVSGLTWIHFAVALTALGLGWNFTFVGASTLLTEAYQPAERAKTQAANDFLVFGTVSLSSLSSGALLHFADWNTVNYMALPAVLLCGAALVWLKGHRRRTATA